MVVSSCSKWRKNQFYTLKNTCDVYWIQCFSLQISQSYSKPILTYGLTSDCYICICLQSHAIHHNLTSIDPSVTWVWSLKLQNKLVATISSSNGLLILPPPDLDICAVCFSNNVASEVQGLSCSWLSSVGIHQKLGGLWTGSCILKVRRAGIAN